MCSSDLLGQDGQSCDVRAFWGGGDAAPADDVGLFIKDKTRLSGADFHRNSLDLISHILHWGND